MKNEYHVVHVSFFYPKIWYPVPKKELNLRAVNFILGFPVAIVQNNGNTSKKITTSPYSNCSNPKGISHFSFFKMQIFQRHLKKTFSKNIENMVQTNKFEPILDVNTGVNIGGRLGVRFDSNKSDVRAGVGIDSVENSLGISSQDILQTTRQTQQYASLLHLSFINREEEENPI